MIVHHSRRKRIGKRFRLRKPCHWISNLILIVALVWFAHNLQKNSQPSPYSSLITHLPELAMSGGDPYIRALMLTISASESNHKNSYFLLYGGSHVHNLKQHPNQCLPIKIGPNKGKCSTAAGRYQFLTSTWQEKAQKYHPNPHKTHGKIIYSFEPKYQDMVVYRWLKDHHQWDVDLLTLLKEDRVEEVLTELSDVWTSLGGGIEDNLMTPHLPSLYRHFLAQQLKSQNSDRVSENLI
ncbi:glycoside hydrolase family 24 [Rippkaea orientalis PCC 8801]|uniref:Glycoside hydrolase family 24 n=1 Tax=Rippkaea orientalis (strain PCC 8801 / RF-1) TaxID=41431 RepID=B7JUQ2_RIPO1|nr:glycoside hydrolase family protein [Rippkaea orientalis]ACK65596.1 glycoside hydrolase family 24 [Rippkaea orientalis PCC 8801]